MKDIVISKYNELKIIEEIIMSKYDDEFKDVKKGVPPTNDNQKSSVNFVMAFTVVGILFGVLILLFQNTIQSEGERLAQYGYVPESMVVNIILALLVGSVQAWIFKARIKSRVHIFIVFSAIGGIVAGILSGIMMNLGILIPFIIGGFNGMIAGGISSLNQNKVMKNEKHGASWFLYSLISWTVIFSIGWPIGWRAESGIALALAIVFIMVASGISLALFLNKTPQIEFS